MNYYLGIDSGGSRIKGVLCTLDASALRTKAGGPGNISVIGKEAFARSLQEVVHSLLAHDSTGQVRAAAFGVAGAGREQEKRAAAEVITELGVKNFRVLSDAELLHYSFFGDGDGILVSSGTGSFCMYRNKRSQLQQVGGWGYLLGDEGSGFRLGREGIRQALREQEGGVGYSRLTKELLTFFGAREPKELITLTYAAASAQEHVASCARVICELASAGEKTADELVKGTANDLLELAATGIKQSENVLGRLALAGSLLRDDSPVTEWFLKDIVDAELKVNRVEQDLEPAAAAILVALKHVGESVSPGLRARLHEINF